MAAALKANDIANIKMRQEAIKELNLKPQWRQYYAATSSLVVVETSAKSIIDWLKNHKPFMPKPIKWLPISFSVLSLVLLGLIIFNIIDTSLIGYWLLVGLGISAIYFKRINHLSSNCDKVKDTFRQYASLLNQIETETFTSKLLQQKQDQIKSEKKKASVIFKEFSKVLDALDNRNNLISAIFGNGLFLLDLK